MLEVLIVAFGAIGVGFGLIFLLALADRRAKKKNPALYEDQGLTQTQFEKACVEVVERMKLDVEEIERSSDNTLEIKAKNPAPIVGGDFFVYCVYLPSNEVVSSAEIIEVSNLIVQDRLSKGILMTNTRFTDDLPAIGELAPLEFIDGERLKTMMANLPMV
jgi:restriction endonuclease Mrr